MAVPLELNAYEVAVLIKTMVADLSHDELRHPSNVDRLRRYVAELGRLSDQSAQFQRDISTKLRHGNRSAGSILGVDLL